MKPILQSKTPRLQYHAPVVSAAAKALADENIPVVEYGEQIRWRHGDPIVLSLVEWAVPDTLFSRSNQILSDRGFPPFTTNADTNGQGQRAYNIYNLGSSLSLYLYPLSFLGLSLQDTTEVSSTFDHTIKVLTPGPAGYMISLICQLLGHPVGDSSRSRVTLDLLSFISFYILRDKPLYTKDGKCDDDESEKDFQKRVEDAVQQMKNWNWGDANSSYLSIAESVVRDCRSIAQLSSD